MYFNYFCQLLWSSSSKYKKTFSESNGNTEYIQESLRVNQSMNSRLINKRNINIFLGLVLAPYFKWVIYNIGPRVYMGSSSLLRMTETLFLASYTKTYRPY